MIIVCAFIPLFSMTGPEGALFGPMANTYAFAICGALLLAVTLTPVLCSFLFHEQEGGERDVRRPDHEAAVPGDARPGPEAPLLAAGGDGVAAGLHDLRSFPSWAASSCRRWRKATSGSGRSCRGRSRFRKRRGWRLGSAR